MKEKKQRREIFFKLSITNMSKGTHHLGVGQVPNFTSEEMKSWEINNLFKDTHNPMALWNHQRILLFRCVDLRGHWSSHIFSFLSPTHTLFTRIARFKLYHL